MLLRRTIGRIFVYSLAETEMLECFWEAAGMKWSGLLPGKRELTMSDVTTYLLAMADVISRSSAQQTSPLTAGWMFDSINSLKYQPKTTPWQCCRKIANRAVTAIFAYKRQAIKVKQNRVHSRAS